ncbi:hypothetical protein SpCBS45565_g05624 [Spizellomyces sp. 'palustris']|nr:hypothetical protein SpCBS45565_g05624 [Spizellomyces sp. 'palustris']
MSSATPTKPTSASPRKGSSSASSKKSVKKSSPLEEKEGDPSLNIIPEPSMNAITNYIRSNGVKRILVLTGAGISTSAGIPDFRSPGTGLYDNLKKYSLPYPEAIFDISYFRRKPEPFFTLARELYPGSFRPTLSHYFIRLLQEKGALLRNFTQNIDTLERVAGIDGDLLVEAHGSFATAHCRGKIVPVAKSEDEIDATPAPDNDTDSENENVQLDPGCGKEYTKEWVKTKIFAGEIPTCEDCSGLIKPDIVFFGESLPERFHKLIATDFRNCDLVIIIGTSLQVAPFSHLINMVPPHIPRLLINREIVAVEEYSSTRGFDFVGGRHKYRRDAVFLGTCDEGCEKLAELLNWGEDLKALVERESKNLQNLQSGEAAKSIAEAIGEAVAVSDAKEEEELIRGMENLLKEKV